MQTASIANLDPTILDNSIFAIINNLMKQDKHINLDNIYNELTKTIDYENTSNEQLHDGTIELIIQWRIIKKKNRSDDSYRTTESIVHFNNEQLEYSNLLANNLKFQKISLISYQKLAVYLKKILIARNMSEELMNQKLSITTYLKIWKLKV